ncbi:MAG: hypothetical protein LC799_25895, partial [Actinobacteria bacterium]|nr:hypothetical protein [Actinomycetota bacterium]
FALTTPVVWAWYFTWALAFLVLWSFPLSVQLAVVALNFTVTPLGPGSLDVNGHPTLSALFVTVVTLVTGTMAVRRWSNGRLARRSVAAEGEDGT